MTGPQYAEYKTNLYTEAMGCVRNSDSSNVFADRIPLAEVRKRFALEEIASYPDALVVPGEADGVNPDGTIHYGTDVTVTDSAYVKIARKRDMHVHGRFGAESGSNRRQYTFLTDTLLTGLTGEGPGDLKITAAGTTRNGGRAYVQIATGEVCGWEGFNFSPFLMVGMSHDGSLSVTSTFGTQIIQCANMVAGIAAKAQGRTKQSARATDAGILARHKIMLGLEEVSELQTSAFDTLRNTVFTDEHWTALLNEVAPVDVVGASPNIETRNANTQATLTNMYRTDARCNAMHGNALGAWQTLNTFDIWERGTRKGTDAGTRATDDYLSGKLGTREGSRVETITKVLALV